MKKFLCLFLISLFLPAMAMAGTKTLKWTAPTDERVSGYYVYINSELPMSEMNRVATLPFGTTEYSLSGLTVGETYFISVTTFSDDGDESDFPKYWQYTAEDNDEDVEIEIYKPLSPVNSLMIMVQKWLF